MSTPPDSPAPLPASDTPAEERLEPVAAILAALVPGAGHLYLGEIRRGVLIAGGILGLFFGGLLIGGIDVVDRKEDGIWFIGQALVGPLAFGVDALHQTQFKAAPAELVEEAARERVSYAALERELEARRRSPGPGETIEVVAYDDPTTPARESHPVRVLVEAGPGQGPPSSKSLGRMNELGTLFVTIAGMLNLIAFIDAAMHTRRRA